MDVSSINTSPFIVTGKVARVCYAASGPRPEHSCHPPSDPALNPAKTRSKAASRHHDWRDGRLAPTSQTHLTLAGGIPGRIRHRRSRLLTGRGCAPSKLHRHLQPMLQAAQGQGSATIGRNLRALCKQEFTRLECLNLGVFVASATASWPRGLSRSAPRHPIDRLPTRRAAAPFPQLMVAYTSLIMPYACPDHDAGAPASQTSGRSARVRGSC